MKALCPKCGSKVNGGYGFAAPVFGGYEVCSGHNCLLILALQPDGEMFETPDQRALADRTAERSLRVARGDDWAKHYFPSWTNQP